MKKAFLVFWTMILVLALATGCLAEAATAGGKGLVIGTLSLLRLTEEEYAAKEEGKRIGVEYLEGQGAYASVLDASTRPGLTGVIFYDRLTDMILALQAGDITSAEVPLSTADYLCAQNDGLAKMGEFLLENADEFTKAVAYRLGVGYSFLTTEDKTGLRDEIDGAITAMKEDGTLDALIGKYITDAASDPEPAEFTKTDGETIRVAITGELPPMDYVAPDGTPAGFNTALLAELGRRLNRNIELLQVDSSGRAAALASGTVDLVFWTNGADGRGRGGRQTAEEHAAFLAEMEQQRTKEQDELMRSLNGGLDYEKVRNMDIPDGTISTQPYFNDLMIVIGLKK